MGLWGGEPLPNCGGGARFSMPLTERWESRVCALCSTPNTVALTQGFLPRDSHPDEEGGAVTVLTSQLRPRVGMQLAQGHTASKQSQDLTKLIR